MRPRDMALLAGVAVVGLIAAFWLLVLSPKREEAAELGQQVEQLEGAVAEQEQIAAAAEQAREDFDQNYQRMVVLGKAVPEDEDTASLFVQLEEIAGDSEVDFRAIRLESTGDAAPPPATEETTTDQAESEDAEGDEEPAPAPDPAPPTETAVAGQPIGSAVGPAGLPVMPYELELRGTFFELADFLDGVDALVRPRSGKPRVSGRLVTVDGFELVADKQLGFPALTATLALNTFVIPSEQGLTAGATPTGPAPAAPTPAASTEAAQP